MPNQTLISAFFAKPTFQPKETKASPTNKSEKRKFVTEFNKKSRCDASKQWNDYLFIANDNFTEYTVINLMPRPNYKLGVMVPKEYEVATATVDDNSALTHIFVKEAFRRQKIGAELIRFINKCCPKFVVFGGTENNSRYRLTQDGGALMTYCVENKILSATQVITSHVPESPNKPARLTFGAS